MCELAGNIGRLDDAVARVGEPRCPTHGVPLDAQTVSQMVDQVLTLPEGRRIMVLAPVVTDRKGEHLHVFKELLGNGFIRARIDGIVTDLETPPDLDKNKKHSIEAVVDRLRVGEGIKQRLAESFETALGLADGVARVVDMDQLERDLMAEGLEKFADPQKKLIALIKEKIAELQPA